MIRQRQRNLLPWMALMVFAVAVAMAWQGTSYASCDGAFGPVSLAAGEELRMNAVCPEAPPSNNPNATFFPCKIVFIFYDGSGAVVGSSDEMTVNPGASASASYVLPYTTTAASTPVSTTIRGQVVFVPSTAAGPGGGQCSGCPFSCCAGGVACCCSSIGTGAAIHATQEIISAGRTSAVLPLLTTRPLR